MRNSAWYHKLWRRKLDELPLHSDAASAWTGMKSVLDESMPVGSAATAAPAVKSLIAKIISATFYVLPAAAMIFTAVHYLKVAEKPGHKSTHSGKQNRKHSANDAQTSFPDSILQDSIAQQSDSLSADRSLVLPGKGMPEGTQRRNHPAIRNKSDEIAQSQNGDSRYRNAHQLQADLGLPATRTSSSASAPQDILHQQAKNNMTAVITIPGNRTDYMLNTKELKLKDEQLKKLKGKQARNLKKTENKADKNNSRGKKSKPVKSKTPKEENDIVTPDYTYGINAGINTGGNGSGLYVGVFGSYALSQRWLIGGGLTLNSSRSISGEYSHNSYYKPDSLPQFKVIDSRKVMVLELPLYAVYKISGKISVKGGPVIGLAFKQHAVNSTIAALADIRDTLYHSKQIDTALRNTVLPKLNIGFKAGVSFQFGQFDLEGTYQIHSPYKVKSDLGAYHKSFQTFSIGIGYRFK